MKLSDIHTPQDIKALSTAELEDLAEQMRQATLFRTSAIGGHVGPNLGVAEIMTAMHYVFDAPRDKIVIDVSHQDFPHKMLTGRAYGFTEESGFDKVGEYTEPRESPEFDLFYGGHTSPALSLATGLAKARELAGDDYKIVAFVGDGSLSGGEAFEGLSNGATIKGNFTLIFNDNQMAIAPDYGGIYPHLQHLRETAGTAPDNIFRAFGWDYIYVAEGNDMAACINALRQAAAMDHPVVVHVSTQKGQGYAPAEEYREEFHWREPFVTSTGALKEDSDTPDYSSVTRDFLLRQCSETPGTLIITAATPAIFGFGPEERARAGKHYMDVCIAEQTAVSVMAGAARGGARPVLGITATFMQRAYDQLIEDWAMNPGASMMLVFSSGIAGIPDETHLGFWDIPFLTSMPEVVYLAPTNMEEYEAMIEWGHKQNDYKVAVRVPSYSIEHASGPVDTDYSEVNRFKVVRRGSQVALIGAGDYFPKALAVADLLAKQGINATVINPRFISGVDAELLLSLAKDHTVVATIEDGSVEGGFGQRVASALGCEPVKVLNFGLPKAFADRYSVAELEKSSGLLPDQIAAKITASL